MRGGVDEVDYIGGEVPRCTIVAGYESYKCTINVDNKLGQCMV